MIHLPEFLSPDLLRPLGLTLLHFIWQGGALAALAALAMALTKSASARYALGIAALLAMVAAPIVTLIVLQQNSSARAVVPQPVSQLVLIHTGNLSDPHSAMGLSNGMHPAPTSAPDKSYLWLVQAWFLGVLLFSMRTAGGVLALERLRRREATPIGDTLLESCLKLQQRLGLHRVIRYCESVHLDAPAVIGWLRPVVLLPVSTLTGLSEAQLLAVIAHELAHIRRYDAFVNLFQVAAESILFYHPAVWWMSQRIRTEREHCCDDIAIAMCGNPLEYARALTLMEELRAAPSLAMAANHGALASRVRRLLGIPSLGAGMRTAGIAAAVLCLSVATVAGNAMFGVARNAATAQEPATEQEQREKDVASAIVVRAPQNPATPAVAPTLSKPAPAPFAAAQAAPQAAPSAPQSLSNQNAQTEAHESYIDGMKAAGVDISSVDDLIAMKMQGITPAYVRSMQAEGIKIDADDLIGMKVQGITPEYIHQMRAEGLQPDASDLIGMKVQGITPEYIHQMKDLGLKTDADDLIGMKVQGVTPEYIREIRAAGIKVDSDDIIGMKVQGITPAYVKEIQALGLHADADDLIGMKVQGVTPEYVKSLQSAGLKFDTDDLIGAKVQGVTPQFIEKARSHGFKDLTLEKLIELKVSGILE